MPSVGMRRTTRVFGVVKGADGARVLRSGRRLWPESGEAKLKRPNDGDEYCQLKKNSQKKDGIGAAARNCKVNGDVDEVPVNESLKTEVEPREDGGRKDRMYGLVYTRKRKRTEVGNFLAVSQDKKYGLQFSRRQTRKTKNYGSGKLMGFDRAAVPVHVEVSPVFCFIVNNNGGNCGWSWWFSCLLSLILGYMKRAKVRLPELAAFLMSQPISGVYCSNGVKIVLGTANGTGVCKFFGAGRFSPLFSVDFFAVPHYFMYIHYSMLNALKVLQYDPVNNLIDEDADDEMMTFIEKQQTCMSSLSNSRSITLDLDSPGNKVVLHSSIRASKLASQRNQYKTGLSSRGIQKRRSSLRRRRARNPSLGGVHKASGALLSDLISSRRNGIPFSSVVSKNKLRSSVRGSSGANLQELNSTMVGLARDVDLSCCSASILVIGTDRCYREEGAVVMPELSSSKEWLLVVKKDGVVKYMHKAQKVMRPCAINRFTHAIIWTEDENWKLEFSNRHEWHVFKELYKECFDRNVPSSSVKVIPVPGVREVPGFEDLASVSFRRPESYISVKADELSRAMAKRTAIYDMDSEDEEWRKEFNNEFFTGSNLLEHLSEDRFELMIDAFEKAHHFSPEDFSNEKAASKLCLDLGRREVVEAVCSYWLKRKEQRHSPLLKIFQAYEVEKAPLVHKPVLRKRRSFKRQASHGRGKQPSFLQAMATEQDAAAEEQNALRNVEAAKVSANRSVESASKKRKRAQLLMENASMSTYKAMMALRIAEAARVAESSDAAGAILFDWE
ncbi:hypothetical protein SLE2022_111040 [Rubroshorea leprosula]